MKIQNHRKAFSMLTAIFVIVIMASIGGMVMSLSGKMVKETTAQFQREQAMLLAKSYTEYAVMAVMSNDRSTNCLHTISGDIGSNPGAGDGYRARIHIHYIGNASEVGNCGGVRVFNQSVITTKSPLTIIVDAYIDYRDPDNTSAEWLTYHKRTLQKI